MALEKWSMVNIFCHDMLAVMPCTPKFSKHDSKSKYDLICQ